mmetsp:Transcript_26713/g.76457  ORF Transcript_26713/g.76457 Transcript_26713/m.76457 type:complete len:241 (-) Transcript_26713:1014-1736(-)
MPPGARATSKMPGQAHWVASAERACPCRRHRPLRPLLGRGRRRPLGRPARDGAGLRLCPPEPRGRRTQRPPPPPPAAPRAPRQNRRWGRRAQRAARAPSARVAASGTARSENPRRSPAARSSSATSAATPASTEWPPEGRCGAAVWHPAEHRCQTPAVREAAGWEGPASRPLRVSALRTLLCHPPQLASLASLPIFWRPDPRQQPGRAAAAPSRPATRSHPEAWPPRRPRCSCHRRRPRR